jgi:hypothetical protein
MLDDRDVRQFLACANSQGHSRFGRSETETLANGCRSAVQLGLGISNYKGGPGEHETSCAAPARGTTYFWLKPELSVNASWVRPAFSRIGPVGDQGDQPNADIKRTSST